MRIAYFSPLPPKHTGIATYSQYLIPALVRHAALDLFDTAVYEPVSFHHPNTSILDYVARPAHLLHLDEYDVCLYHLGNNPWHHMDIYRVFLLHPGIVVLHDAVLYYLIAFLGMGGLVKEFCLNYGQERLAECWNIQKDSPDGNIIRYPYPERYPLLKRTLDRAKAVIVHSKTTKQQLLDAGCQKPIYVIPMITAPEYVDYRCHNDIAGTRSELGIMPDEQLISSFGFIGRTKRMQAVSEALAHIKERHPFKWLIVGEGEDLASVINAYQLQDQVIQTGFVNDQDRFNRYLAASDIVINLRYPSMGETSLTLIHAMSYGKACIVTDHAWFSELSNECVLKIGYGKTEAGELKQALTKLLVDDNLRQTIGSCARQFVKDHCLPNQVADRYVDALLSVADLPDKRIRAENKLDSECSLLQPASLESIEKSSELSTDWVKNYFVERALQALQF